MVAAAGVDGNKTVISCVCPYACVRGWVVGCADAGIYLALITNVLGYKPIESLMMASICEEKSPESMACVCVCVRIIGETTHRAEREKKISRQKRTQAEKYTENRHLVR